MSYYINHCDVTQVTLDALTDLYTEAHTSIFTLMTTDSFRRYVTTVEFKQLEAELEKSAF